MVKITKVYTRTGDKGTTSVAGGIKIKKNAARINAIGSVDELNSVLGWCAQLLKQDQKFQNLFQRVQRLQNELFNLGAQLAVLPEHRRDNTPVVTEQDIKALEQSIDEMNDSLPMLQSFILPGGGELGSRFHMARSVCRRVERELLTLLESDKAAEPVTLAYLNRLSDWLFVAARYVAQLQGESESLWVVK